MAIKIIFDNDEVINEIIHIINSYESTFTGANIRAAFNKGGVYIDQTTSPKKLFFNEESVKENDGFQAIWDKNVPIESLSARSRNKHYGCINQNFFDQEQ